MDTRRESPVRGIPPHACGGRLPGGLPPGSLGFLVDHACEKNCITSCTITMMIMINAVWGRRIVTTNPSADVPDAFTACSLAKWILGVRTRRGRSLMEYLTRSPGRADNQFARSRSRVTPAP